MKKITFFLFSIFFSLSLFSQTTHDIDWRTGTNGDLIITEGDSVRWTWGDTFSHSVTSTTGVESFDTGTLPINNLGHIFTHKFTLIGDTNYICNVHGSMTGKITVQVLSIEDEEKNKLEIYPNPVTNKLFIKGPSKISKITITSILGKKILEKQTNDTSMDIDMSVFRNGSYFIKIESNNSKQTYRIIKK